MVIDSSALLAILFDEPEAASFADRIAEEHDPIISAATLAEASIVMRFRYGERGVAEVEELLRGARVRCVAVDDIQVKHGLHGPGPALKFGQLFSYGLAMAHGRPLLFKGDDFRHTNVEPAL